MHTYLSKGLLLTLRILRIILFLIDYLDKFIISSRNLTEEVEIALAEPFISHLVKPLLVHQHELLGELVDAAFVGQDLRLLNGVAVGADLNYQVLFL